MGLLDTQQGRDIVQGLACYLSKRRMSRRFHRSFYIAFDAWKNTGVFSLETMLNELNDTDQGEINKLNELLVQLGCSTIGAPFNGGTYQVNADTGSDETGDGTYDNPFATLNFMMGPYFPKVLDYKTSVVVRGDVDMSGSEMLIHQEIGPDGSLSIVGAGDPTVVTTSQGAGPFTLTGVTQVGTPVACNNLAVAETFGVNELYGKWILFKSGACSGNAVPCHDNTASNLFTRGGLNGVPIIGDTFQIVEPTPSITCSRWDCEVKGATYGPASTPYARFNIYNLKIDIQDVLWKNDNFRLKNTCDSQISFVTLISASDQFSYCQIESNLNNAPAYDVGAQYEATTQVNNIQKPAAAENAGFLMKRGGFPPATFGFDDVQVRRALDVRAIDTAGRMSIDHTIGGLTNCGIGQLRWINGSSGGAHINYISGAPAAAAFYVYHGGAIKAEYNYLKAGQDAFEIEMGMLAVYGNTHGTFTGYGFRFGQKIGYVSTSQNPAAWVGTTGAIYFAGGVGTTAFPVGTDARVTDAIANFFARIETA